MTSIEDGVFYDCSSLTSATISNAVTSIGDQAFYDCSRLTSVSIPNALTNIGFRAFYNCSDLTSITVPKSVTSIGDDAFHNCSGLTSIIVERGNTVYDSRNNCNAIIVTAINKLIKGCENTVIPKSVTSIGDHAFLRCSGLTFVTIPNSVISIGNYAFMHCSGLTSFIIPNSVTSIGISAFNGCSGLTSIVTPQNVTNIRSGVFADCISLTSIVVESGNTVYDSRNNCNAIIHTSANRLIAGCKNTIVPNSVTSIGDYAFYRCNGLTSITIPNSVTCIEESAFRLCTKLTDVYCLASKTPQTGTDVFKDSYIEYATLHVPKSSVNLYKMAEPWNNFKEIVAIESPKHKLTYILDGEIYKTYQIEEGENIPQEASLTKEGFIFSGWSWIPSVMPAEDVTITGSFTANKYKLTYMLDGEEYKSEEVEYGSAITPLVTPEKDTYLFTGWTDIPETMPSHDVVVTGTYKRYFDMGHVVKVINFILNENAAAEDVTLFDLNKDIELSIGDIVLMMRYVLNSMSRAASTRATVGGTLPNIAQYTAAQFVLQTPLDVKEQDIHLVKDIAQTHQMMCKEIEPGVFAVGIYSMTNSLFMPENGAIFEVDTEDSSVSISNVLLAKPSGETKRFDELPVLTPVTAVEKENDIRSLYDLKGQKRNQGKSLQKGIYIMNGKKRMVK